MRIHILGTGALGTLLGFHLRRTLPSSSRITLILKPKQGQSPSPRSPLDRRKFEALGPNKTIRVERGGVRDAVSGFEWEIANWGQSPLEQIVYDEQGSVRKSFTFNELASTIDTKSLEKFEFMRPLRQSTLDHISILIVSTKSQTALPALKNVVHRLSQNSTIVLLQNGMGIYEELVDKIWRNAQHRPHFILGSSTHAVYGRGDFDVVHSLGQKSGDLHFGVVPDWKGEDGQDYERSFYETEDGSGEGKGTLNVDDILPPPGNPSITERYQSLHSAVSALLTLKELAPSWLPINDMQSHLRQKLVANCIISPLTALLWCRNGDLFTSNVAQNMARRVCTEAEAVFYADLLRESGATPIPSISPSSNGLRRYHHQPTLTDAGPQLPSILTSQALFAHTIATARATSHSLSTMAVDVQRGNQSEIRYMNGYLAALGAEVGVPTPTVSSLADIVLMKRAISPLNAHYLDEYDPFRRGQE